MNAQKITTVTVDQFEAKMRRILDLKKEMHEAGMTLRLSENDTVMYNLWVQSWKQCHRLEIVKINAVLKEVGVPYRICFNPR